MLVRLLIKWCTYMLCVAVEWMVGPYTKPGEWWLMMLSFYSIWPDDGSVWELGEDQHLAAN